MQLAVVGWVLRLFTTGCGVQEFVFKVYFQTLEIQKLKKILFASTLYVFGHIDTLFSLCFIKTEMRCCYLFSTTGILTKELLEITIFILTADFL